MRQLRAMSSLASSAAYWVFWEELLAPKNRRGSKRLMGEQTSQFYSLRHPLIWGIGMIAFATCFTVGTFLGGWYRYSWSTIEVPWGNQPDDVPDSPEEAWYWITFTHDAVAFGTSSKEIKSVYQAAKRNNYKPHLESAPWPGYTVKPPSDATVSKPTPESTSSGTNTDSIVLPLASPAPH